MNSDLLNISNIISNLNRGDSALITIRKDILSTLTNLINNIDHIFVKIFFNNKQCIVGFIYIPFSFAIIIIIYKYFIDSVQSVISAFDRQRLYFNFLWWFQPLSLNLA